MDGDPTSSAKKAGCTSPRELSRNHADLCRALDEAIDKSGYMVDNSIG